MLRLLHHRKKSRVGGGRLYSESRPRVIKRWPSLIVEYLAILIILAAASVNCTGCIWLALPSLAYEGYKYAHQAPPSASPDGNGSSANSQPASRGNSSSDHSIE
jgi:hypothetical protein